MMKRWLESYAARFELGVSDGAAAAQKALRFLATGPMSNMLCLGRDWAHAASVATKGALLADDDFRTWWNDVFDKRHALVPDIKKLGGMHSDVAALPAPGVGECGCPRR